MKKKKDYRTEKRCEGSSLGGTTVSGLMVYLLPEKGLQGEAGS